MTDPFSVSKDDDNWISFTVLNDSGYDRTAFTGHGTDEYIAAKLGIEDYDGKFSTILKRVTEFEAYFKGLKAPKASGR